VILRITINGVEPALQPALKLYLVLWERSRGGCTPSAPHCSCSTISEMAAWSLQWRAAFKWVRQFRGGCAPPAPPRSCICTVPVIPYRVCSCLLANGVSDLQYTPQQLCVMWASNLGGLQPLWTASLNAWAPHTVVQSQHLWLGCCFLCLLSGIARLRLLLQVLCQVLDAGPLPGPRLPVLVSAVKLLPSLLCCCKCC